MSIAPKTHPGHLKTRASLSRRMFLGSAALIPGIPARQRKLVNPLSGEAFDLEGADCNQLAIAPAPAFASAQQAGEAPELYWMALLRDVSFLEYDTTPLAQTAAGDLSSLTDFRGPKSGGQVTTGTLFRGVAPGDLAGPYLSQFLWQPVPF